MKPSSEQLKNNFEFYQLKPVFKASPFLQIFIIALLHLLTTIGCYLNYRSTGMVYGYPVSGSLIFVPIYEELIFRGVVLKYFECSAGMLRAIVYSSLLFGLWHIKNIFWLNSSALLIQVTYTTLIFGPVAAWLTLKTRTLWPAVIIHYLNNFPVDPYLDAFGHIKRI
jgi:uncharacterized protein